MLLAGRALVHLNLYSSSHHMPTMSREPLSSRHSPATSLASLEYLQTQRRGSITDPSLHAASSKFYRHPADQHSSSSSSTLHESSSKHYLPDPRPSSPYVFGDATAHPVEPSSQLRKLLHSPSLEHSAHRPPPSLSHDSQEPPRAHSGTQRTTPHALLIKHSSHRPKHHKGVQSNECR